MQYNGILKELKSLSNPRAIEGMVKYGISPRRTYGGSILNLGKIAKEGKRFRKWIQGVLDGLLLTQFTN